MHEIWYGGPGDTNNAICKVSVDSINNFLFYNNLQQILVLFAAFCSKPLVVSSFYWNTLSEHFQNCSEAPKIKNIKFQPNTLLIV